MTPDLPKETGEGFRSAASKIKGPRRIGAVIAEYLKSIRQNYNDNFFLIIESNNRYHISILYYR
jgi:hypothetical protein